MAFLRYVLFLTALAIIATRHAAFAQDEFGKILLQAFTTGMFNGKPASESVGPTQTPKASSTNAFPKVTLQPAAPEPSAEPLFGSPEESLDESPEQSAEHSLAGKNVFNPNMEYSPEASPVIDVTTELFGSPDESPAEAPEETSDDFDRDESSPADGVLTAYDPIRVNCGSFDERNTFSQDTERWFNPDSLVADDPFASAQFLSTSDTLLYSTYRYASGNLTYTVPVHTKGVWRVTLQWAEIAPQFMDEGARVFTVYLNGKEFENEIDVYRDSPLGSYSPLVRTYTVNAYNSVVSIVLGHKVGEAMLSAFQITYISPFLALRA